MKLLFWVIATLVLTSCASTSRSEVGVVLPENNFSLNDIRTAIQNVIGGKPRYISENFREIKSDYFSRKREIDFHPLYSKERSYAHFIILGERRPYDIKIIVYVESRTKAGFEQIGIDQSFARKVGKELLDKLNQSRDNRNVIDDFRSF
jgi:hypothetical protein